MPFAPLKGESNTPCDGNEALEKASHDAGFLVEDLQAALKAADPVAAIPILQYIEKAATLQREIEALRAALSQKGASE